MVLEGTCLEGIIEPAIARVGVATYVKWQPKGHPVQFSAPMSVSVICFDFKTSQKWIFGAEFVVSVLKELICCRS